MYVYENVDRCTDEIAKMPVKQHQRRLSNHVRPVRPKTAQKREEKKQRAEKPLEKRKKKQSMNDKTKANNAKRQPGVLPLTPGPRMPNAIKHASQQYFPLIPLLPKPERSYEIQ